MKVPESFTHAFIAHGSQSISADTWPGILQGSVAMMYTYDDEQVVIYEWVESMYLPVYNLNLEEH